MTALITVLGYVAVILIGIFIRAQGLVREISRSPWDSSFSTSRFPARSSRF